ncbi:hypothetical protein [Marinilactibacillus kalidii]|uniref:hypothetical protein n=1 Tax=Marinilactibacillus kalidii TaxID=2820274 RepID=UPI001ABE16D9|nr:hypothetical protein [Marinilactibacillus kalidii]
MSEFKEDISKVRKELKVLDKAVQYIGFLLILIAVLIPLTIQKIIYPVMHGGEFDFDTYALETNVNLIRYMGLAFILLIIGMTSVLCTRNKKVK